MILRDQVINKTPMIVSYNVCQTGNAIGCGDNARRAGYNNDTAPTAVYVVTPKE